MEHANWCLINKPECGPLHCTCHDRTTAERIEIKYVPTYHVGSTDVLQFLPLPKRGVPGFTHRVILNGVSVDWLGDNASPSLKTARYYAVKHCEKLKSND